MYLGSILSIQLNRLMESGVSNNRQNINKMIRNGSKKTRNIRVLQAIQKKPEKRGEQVKTKTPLAGIVAGLYGDSGAVHL